MAARKKLCAAGKHVAKGRGPCALCAKAADFERRRKLAEIGMEMIERAASVPPQASVDQYVGALAPSSYKTWRDGRIAAGARVLYDVAEFDAVSPRGRK